MAKLFQLDINLSDDFIVIGICTALPDYTLAWHINKNTAINLFRKEDLKIVPTKSIEVGYSFFLDEQDPSAHYYLIQNKNQSGSLFKEQKNLDYLLLIKDIQDESLPIDAWITKLKNVTGLTFVYKINTELMKNIDTVLTEIELHIIEISKTKANEIKKKY